VAMPFRPSRQVRVTAAVAALVLLALVPLGDSSAGAGRGRRVAAGGAVPGLAAPSSPPDAPGSEAMRVRPTVVQPGPSGRPRPAPIAAGSGLGSRDDPALRQRVLARLGRMRLEDKVGQVFMTQVYGRGARDLGMASANRRAYGVDDAEQVIERYRPGGVIYFDWSGNLHEPRQITALSTGLQRAAMRQPAAVPLLIATDQEQGLVGRIGPPATQLPGSMALGAARSDQLAAAAAGVTGDELRAMGIALDLAPVADVNVNPGNPVIGVRSFGSDPALVARLVASQVRAYQRAGVAATAKHFPGHGDTDVDSHTGLPVIHHSRAQLERVDLPPFRAAISSGVAAVMTAHVVVPALDPSGRPATLSRPIVTGLLRQRLGFDGVVITDALEMAGVRQMFGDDRVPVEALKAGVDMLLMPPDGSFGLQYRAVLRAVRSGAISRARLDQAVYRILRLKDQFGLFAHPMPAAGAVAREVGAPAHLAVAQRVAERSVTLLRDDAGLLPLAPRRARKVLVTGPSVATATLAGLLGERGVAVRSLATGSDPGGATVARAAVAARGSDLVVAATRNLSAGHGAGQRALVRALAGSGRPLVTVAVGNPYDLAYLPGVRTSLATYSERPASLAALVRVLFGEVRPSGRLPVTVPAPGRPGRALYPFGSGLPKHPG
jgi:beta-N-acetylhexosaminidase